MPSYTVPINGPNGPGFITVNASSPAAAQDNASQGGNYATGPAVSGGHQATTGAGGTAVPSTSTPTSTPATTPSSVDVANQYATAIQQAQAALAAGNREAFQRAIYEWDQTFGFDKEKFAEDTRRFNEQFGVTQAGLTGMYKDQPTLPALTSYANQFGQWGVPTTGQQTLAAQNQYFTQGLAGINAAAALQANPFRQQQVLGQLSGLYGNQGVAGFQAPNVVAGVGTMGQGTSGQNPNTSPAGWNQHMSPASWNLNREAGPYQQPGRPPGAGNEQMVTPWQTAPGMQGGGGWTQGAPRTTPEGMMFAQDMVTLPNGQQVSRQQAYEQGWTQGGGGRGVAGAAARGGTGMGYLQQMIDDIKDPTANQTMMNDVLNATPTPNKLNSVDFLRAAPSTQGMVLQAMQEKYGLDPNDSLKQIQATLPQFQAPSTLTGFKR